MSLEFVDDGCSTFHSIYMYIGFYLFYFVRFNLASGINACDGHYSIIWGSLRYGSDNERARGADRPAKTRVDGSPDEHDSY